MNAPDLVEAGNYPTPLDAQVARARLAAAGIEAAIFDAELANSWVYTNALGGVRLMVAPGDLDAARNLLAEDEPVDGDVVAAGEEISDDAPWCPRCHSKDVESREEAGSLRRLFGIRRQLHCRACDHEWRE